MESRTVMITEKLIMPADYPVHPLAPTDHWESERDYWSR